MNNDEIAQRAIDEIHVACPRDFLCLRSGVSLLRRSQEIGRHTFLECLDDQPGPCRFAVNLGFRHLCTCSLRAYISRHLDEEPCASCEGCQ